MNPTVDIQCASTEAVPAPDAIRKWVTAALASQPGLADKEVSVRLVDLEEMALLNQTYRGKAGPTNVLSFPAALPPGVDLPLLGDVVVCAPLVRIEAAAQDKTVEAHWALLLVHGVLHLLGHDHAEEGPALAMEALETHILAGLNYPCPYPGNPPLEHIVQ